MNYVALGVVMACKNEGRTLELERKEKWCVDEVKTLKAIVVTVVGTKTRLSAVENKQWRSLRGKDYLSKQGMKRQVRGSLVIVSEIRETLRLFTRLVTERDMLPCHITLLLRELHWLPVCYRTEYKILLLTFNVLPDMAPDYLRQLISILPPS